MAGDITFYILLNFRIVHSRKKIPAAVVFPRMLGAKPIIFAQTVRRFRRGMGCGIAAMLPCADARRRPCVFLPAAGRPDPVYIPRELNHGVILRSSLYSLYGADANSSTKSVIVTELDERTKPKMRVADIIRKRLEQEFKPLRLEITDESHRHAGHVGARDSGETHFDVCIISEAFAGKNKVARHRMVYAALHDLMDAPVHALALTTRTPGETSGQ